ncbi:exodeoxyribonuclease I [Thorsellia kenyensis]|uniref:Exodeoxyribonuclease I n=1 Tax=Thorsellia kenyensis TaxID=1549888 RepID=A0ABV6C6S5_9GAMM
MTTATPASFYIYDFETFGTHPALDRPSQFAGIRVDHHLNPIEEPLVIYCKQADDYLPNPEAVLITGITPQLCNQKGVSEAEFSRLIHEAFSKPNTCILGYNTIKFDDEVTRHLFYRNFIDPYAHHWQNGNSRWDMVDVVRATYALRPDGINWPLNDEGFVNFKLEALTQANGIVHESAHDAMSDVFATLEIMRLIMAKQPRIFQYLFTHRDKQKLISLLDFVDPTPLVHISSMYGAARSNMSIILPICWHPSNKNTFIAYDLTLSPTPLFSCDPQKIREHLFTPKSKRDANYTPVGLMTIALNKCPILAPIKTLLPDTILHLNLNFDVIDAHIALLKSHSEFRHIASEVFNQEVSFNSDTISNDVDNQLYSGFFSQADKHLFEQIRSTIPKNLSLIDIKNDDKRIEQLFFRYKAKNFPFTLNIDEQDRWLAHRKDKLTPQALEKYVAQLENLVELNQENPKNLMLLKRLFDYLQAIAQ